MGKMISWIKKSRLNQIITGVVAVSVVTAAILAVGLGVGLSKPKENLAPSTRQSALEIF
jgi:hypothetical protein